ncbi:hypothetical protein G647_03882 [Cladophialophora carrionii CBS 160.54]|uniref:Uncharacterized protein n=1 Tax=Cladophialophora carrionii CBS 160.54 TaxID=1279043 RepID=V9DDW3_9EURO|nr:uncharacterized protein G647_03882 [Cladophialophora carrionii CBS 160.54]ETI24513.1 hypothetical protein G647_03882 [Cladophialophora carrionii CBS 160.54]
MDWRTPIIMVTAFPSAILFAVAHHILNLKLDGREVTELAVDQQWISRAGNALAYVVKVLLLLATGTAYFQRVWHHARGKPTKLSQFDSLFGVQDSIFEFRHVKFWLRRPVLLLVAMVLWLIPLVAITTPGTLSVVSASVSQPRNVSVQQREYGKSSYAAAVQADNGTVFYGGARSYLKGPTLAMLVETKALSVGSFSTNLTWSMEFHGPAISCSKAGPEVTSQLTDMILPYQKANKTSLMYDAWVPRPSSSPNQALVDGMLVLDPDVNSNLRMLDQISPDAARIYYSLAPDAPTQATMANPIYVISCALYNATWSLDFDVRSTGEQLLKPTLRFENWMPGWSSITPALTPGTHTNTILDYAGLVETFGAITSGRLDYPDDETLPFTQTSLALETSPVLFNDAFPDPFNDAAMVTLARTFEALFQNMTLSARYAVLPRQELRDDASDWSFVNVAATSTFSRNVYRYDSRDLIIAYTLAIVGSALCVLAAMLAIRDMGAVYSNVFSTAVRVTRSQDRLDTVIRDDHDRSGAQPLPPKIANAYIWVAKENKVGIGVGRGRVDTDESLASQKELRRSWWGREQEMDLEKSQSVNPVHEPVVIVSKGSGAPGGWI